MYTSFISPEGTGETRNINILSNNEKVMWAYETEVLVIIFLYL